MSDGDLSTFGAGFPVLILLGFLSAASITILIAKILELRGTHSKAGDSSGNNSRAPAVVIAHEGQALVDRGLGNDEITLDLVTRGNAATAKLSRHVRTLEVIAMIAPLLGLLGTVLGMIQSFQSLELAAGAANASVLAGGIWQALLTTAAGLLVAIPAAVGAAYVVGRVEAVTLDIEAVIARVALSAKPAKRS